MNGDGTCIKLWSYDDVPGDVRAVVASHNDRVGRDADWFAVVPKGAIVSWFRGRPVFNNSWRATAELFKRLGDVVWFDVDGLTICAGRL